MIHQPPHNMPGHPWQPDNAAHHATWEHFAFTADTNAELGEQMAMLCLAGWSVWIASSGNGNGSNGDDGLIDTPDGMRFGAVMYRAKKL